MTQSNPQILATNDDGIVAPGILSLKDALGERGRVSHWHGGSPLMGVEEDGTDIWAAANG